MRVIPSTKIQKDPFDSKGYTHTRLPEGRRRTKVKANVHVRAPHGQKDEDIKRGQTGQKVYVVAMKRNQVHRDKQ